MREAELADGTVLEFPDETTDEVMQAAVKRHLAGSQPAAPSAAAPPQGPPAPVRAPTPSFLGEVAARAPQVGREAALPLGILAGAEAVSRFVPGLGVPVALALSTPAAYHGAQEASAADPQAGFFGTMGAGVAGGLRSALIDPMTQFADDAAAVAAEGYEHGIEAAGDEFSRRTGAGLGAMNALAAGAPFVMGARGAGRAARGVGDDAARAVDAAFADYGQATSYAPTPPPQVNPWQAGAAGGGTRHPGRPVGARPGGVVDARTQPLDVLPAKGGKATRLPMKIGIRPHGGITPASRMGPLVEQAVRTTFDVIGGAPSNRATKQAAAARRPGGAFTMPDEPMGPRLVGEQGPPAPPPDVGPPAPPFPLPSIGPERQLNPASFIPVGPAPYDTWHMPGEAPVPASPWTSDLATALQMARGELPNRPAVAPTPEPTAFVEGTPTVMRRPASRRPPGAAPPPAPPAGAPPPPPTGPAGRPATSPSPPGAPSSGMVPGERVTSAPAAASPGVVRSQPPTETPPPPAAAVAPAPPMPPAAPMEGAGAPVAPTPAVAVPEPGVPTVARKPRAKRAPKVAPTPEPSPSVEAPVERAARVEREEAARAAEGAMARWRETPPEAPSGFAPSIEAPKPEAQPSAPVAEMRPDPSRPVYTLNNGNRFRRFTVTEGDRTFTYDVRVREGRGGPEMASPNARAAALREHMAARVREAAQARPARSPDEPPAPRWEPPTTVTPEITPSKPPRPVVDAPDGRRVRVGVESHGAPPYGEKETFGYYLVPNFEHPAGQAWPLETTGKFLSQKDALAEGNAAAESLLTTPGKPAASARIRTTRGERGVADLAVLAGLPGALARIVSGHSLETATTKRAVDAGLAAFGRTKVGKAVAWHTVGPQAVEDPAVRAMKEDFDIDRALGLHDQLRVARQERAIPRPDRGPLMRAMSGLAPPAPGTPEAAALAKHPDFAKAVADLYEKSGKDLVELGHLDQQAFNAQRGHYVRLWHAAKAPAHPRLVVTTGEGGSMPPRVRKAGFTKQRKVIPLVERQKLGLLEDAGASVALDAPERSATLAKAKFLRGVQEAGPDFFRPSKGLAPADKARLLAEGWQELPPSRMLRSPHQQAPRAYDLSEGLVHPDLYQDVRVFAEIPSNWTAFVRGMLSGVKGGYLSATVATGTNFIGAGAQANKAGLPFHEMAPRLGVAVRDMVLQDGSPTWREAVENGLTELVEVDRRVAMDLARDLDPGAAAFDQGSSGLNAFARGAQAFGKAVSRFPLVRAFGVNDAMWKLTLYRSFKEQGMAPREAARAAKEAIHDYRTGPDWLQALKRSPYGAVFPTFPVKSLLQDAYYTAARPLTMLKWWVMLDVLRQAASDQMGETADERRERENLVGMTGHAGKVAVPGGTKDVPLYANPAGLMGFAPRLAEVRKDAAGEWGAEWNPQAPLVLQHLAFGAEAYGMPGPIAPLSGPLPAVEYGAFYGRDLHTGEPLARPGEEGAEAAGSVAGGIGEQLMPGFARQVRQEARISRGENYEYGREVPRGLARARNWLGPYAQPIPTVEIRRQAVTGVEHGARETYPSSSELRKMSPARRRQEMREAAEREKALWKGYREKRRQGR